MSKNEGRVGVRRKVCADARCAVGGEGRSASEGRPHSTRRRPQLPRLRSVRRPAHPAMPDRSGPHAAPAPHFALITTIAHLLKQKKTCLSSGSARGAGWDEIFLRQVLGIGGHGRL